MVQNKTMQRLKEIDNETSKLSSVLNSLNNEREKLRIKNQKYIHGKNIRELKKLLKGSNWHFGAREIKLSKGICEDFIMYCDEELRFRREVAYLANEKKIALTGIFTLNTDGYLSISPNKDDLADANNLSILVKKYDLKLNTKNYQGICDQYKEYWQRKKDDLANANQFLDEVISK